MKLIETDHECAAYVNNAPIDFHIQQFISYTNEVGIFYYRWPGDSKGRISGIVRKEFLTVTGDGQSRISDLLKKDTRSLLQLDSLHKMYGAYLDTVLKAGEAKLLVPYGNHARGALFLDDSHLADEQLNDVVNNICNGIDQFYFGRLDIKYNSWEELKKGRKLFRDRGEWRWCRANTHL